MARKKAQPTEPKCPPCESVAAPESVTRVRGTIEEPGKRTERLTEKKKAFFFPHYGFYRKTKKEPCGYVKGKPLPPGYSELEMVSDRDAASRGVRPGPAVRLCLAQGKVGPIVAVDTPEAAAEIGAEFRKCVTGRGKDSSSCALDALRTRFPRTQRATIKFGGVKSRKKRSTKKRTLR